MVFDRSEPDPRHRSYARYLHRFAALETVDRSPLGEAEYLHRLDELDELILREVEGRLGLEDRRRLGHLTELLIEDLGDQAAADRIAEGRDNSATALWRAGALYDVEAFLDEEAVEAGLDDSGDGIPDDGRLRDDEVAESSLSMGPPSSRARLRRERWRDQRRRGERG